MLNQFLCEPISALMCFMTSVLCIGAGLLAPAILHSGVWSKRVVDDNRKAYRNICIAWCILGVLFIALGTYIQTNTPC